MWSYSAFVLEKRLKHEFSFMNGLKCAKAISAMAPIWGWKWIYGRLVIVSSFFYCVLCGSWFSAVFVRSVTATCVGPFWSGSGFDRSECDRVLLIKMVLGLYPLCYPNLSKALWPAWVVRFRVLLPCNLGWPILVIRVLTSDCDQVLTFTPPTTNLFHGSHVQTRRCLHKLILA